MNSIIAAIVKSYDARVKTNSPAMRVRFDHDQILAAVRESGAALAVNRPCVERTTAVSAPVFLR